MRCYQRYKTLRRDTVPSWAPRAKKFPVRQGTGHLHMRIPSQHSRRTRIHRATWSLPAPLSSLSTSVTSPSSCPCISVKNKGEKEVDESGKRRKAGEKIGRGERGLTRSEQRIPAAKQAMKPFILVPELNEVASTT